MISLLYHGSYAQTGREIVLESHDATVLEW